MSPSSHHTRTHFPAPSQFYHGAARGDLLARLAIDFRNFANALLKEIGRVKADEAFYESTEAVRSMTYHSELLAESLRTETAEHAWGLQGGNYGGRGRGPAEAIYSSRPLGGGI